MRKLNSQRAPLLCHWRSATVGLSPFTCMIIFFFLNDLAAWKWYHILTSECLKEISTFVGQVKFTLIIPRVAPVWPWAFYSLFIRKTWNGNLTSKPQLSSGQFLCHSFSFLFISNMQGWVWFHLAHERVPHITRTKRHCSKPVASAGVLDILISPCDLLTCTYVIITWRSENSKTTQQAAIWFMLKHTDDQLAIRKFICIPAWLTLFSYFP